MPNIAIRTTLIAGYPGETQEDFQEMYDWVEEMKFDRLGVFPYSHEENTHAFNFDDDVPDEVKQERADEIMELQEGISASLNEAKIGKTFKVLFDRMEGGYFIGRTEYDSPEVDNEVLVPADAQEAYQMIYASMNFTKPTYIRLGRAKVPTIFDESLGS